MATFDWRITVVDQDYLQVPEPEHLTVCSCIHFEQHDDDKRLKPILIKRIQFCWKFLSWLLIEVYSKVLYTLFLAIIEMYLKMFLKRK